MSNVDLTLKLSHHSKIFRFCCHVFPVSVNRQSRRGGRCKECFFAYFRGVDWSGTQGLHTVDNSDQDAMTPLPERANAAILSRTSDWPI